MNEIMLDLETLGVEPGCVILSIGACFFDRKQIGETFYQVIDLEDSLAKGMSIRPATLKWWFKQSKEALEGISTPGVSLETALHCFSQWVRNHTSNPVVWGNGSDFDNAILAEAYKRIDFPKPWGDFANRCYRTLKNEFPEVKISRDGVYHHAVDDAINQAEHVIKLRNLCIP